MAPTSMSYTSNGVIPEEVPELEDDEQSMNGEVQPASTFEGGEESRPRRRGGRNASVDNHMREIAASMTRIELSMQQAREEQTAFFARQDAYRQEELKWRAEQDTRWAQQMALQVAWQDRWGQYIEEQRANWKANQQWQQEMKQRFSSWPNYPPPPPK